MLPNLICKSVSKALGTPISAIIREATKKYAAQLNQQAIFMQEGQDALIRIKLVNM